MNLKPTVAMTTKITLDTASDITKILTSLKDEYAKDAAKLASSPRVTEKTLDAIHARKRRLTEGNVVRALIAHAIEHFKDGKNRGALLDLMAKDMVVRGAPGSAEGGRGEAR